MNLEEIGINAGNWVDSAQDRSYWRVLVNAALNTGFHKLKVHGSMNSRFTAGKICDVTLGGGDLSKETFGAA